MPFSSNAWHRGGTGVLTAALLTLSLTACGSDSSDERADTATTAVTSATTAPTDSSDAADATLIEQLEDQIVRDGATPDTAKLLFSLQVNPLPGVTIPDGEVGESLEASTGLNAMYSVWDQLSAADRDAVVQEFGEPAGTASTDSTTGDSNAGDSATDSADASGRGAEADLSGAPRVAWHTAGDQQSAAYYRNFIYAANGAIGGVLGEPTIDAFTIEVTTNKGAAWAESSSFWKPTKGDKFQPYDDGACHIWNYSNHMQGQSDTTVAQVMAHEVFHCFQSRWMGSGERFVSLPPWVMEGEAAWVGETVAPDLESPLPHEWWEYYVNHHRNDVYAKRIYDAIGLYGHAQDVQGGPLAVWPKLRPMALASAGGDSGAALFVLIGGDPIGFYTTWGSSYFLRGSAYPAAWNMTGPGPVAEKGPTPNRLTLTSGGVTNIDPVEAWKVGLNELSAEGVDVAQVIVLHGYGRVGDSGSLDRAVVSGETLTLCLKDGGCTCPSGSHGAGLTTVNASEPINVALAGGDTGTTAWAAGRTLDEYCKEPDPNNPTPPALPGGGGGGGGGGDALAPHPPKEPKAEPGAGPTGSSNGDPHLVTFDQRPLEFQAVGEYTLTTTRNADFTVQARQEPAEGSRFASVNTAVAVGSGAHRMTVTMESGTAVLRVDGRRVDDDAATAGDGDAALTVRRLETSLGSTFIVTRHDGTIVRIATIGAAGLEARVTINPALAGKVDGLLGNADGNRDNDALLPGGRALPSEPSPNAVRALAARWAVTQASTRFDYAAGTGVGSFDDPAFPAAAPTFSAAEQAAARKACADSGVTDEALLDACTFDVLVTGKQVFAIGYGRTQRVVTAAAASGGEAGTTAEQRFTGTLSGPSDQPTHTFAGTAGQIVFVGTPECTDSAEDGEVDIQAPDGTSVGAGIICHIGRLVLPATGTYTAVLNPFARSVSGPYVVPIRPVRADRVSDAALGDELRGTIDQLAAHDVYRLTVDAGDTLGLGVPGCDAGGLLVEIQDAQGGFLETFDPCAAGQHRFDTAGTYLLVVNSRNEGPSPYRIPTRRL